MHAYVINIMVVLMIFPVILQTGINVIILSTGRHYTTNQTEWSLGYRQKNVNSVAGPDPPNYVVIRHSILLF